MLCAAFAVHVAHRSGRFAHVRAVRRGAWEAVGVQVPETRYARSGDLRLAYLRSSVRARPCIAVAKRFALLRGIGYDAWRDVGVPEDVLSRADIAVEVVAR